MRQRDNFSPLFAAWLDAAMPQRQGPLLGKVESAEASSQGYCCSVALLDELSLEETGEKLEKVAINAVWAGPDGSGVYSLPAVGQVVVVGFIAMNRSLPFVMGTYTAGQATALEQPLEEGELVLQQAASQGGAQVRLGAGGLISLANQQTSLKELLMAFIDDLSGVKSIPAAPGSPVTLSPDDIAKIQGYKAKFAMLLGD